MKVKRMLALAMAGLLTATSVNAGPVTAYAQSGDEAEALWLEEAEEAADAETAQEEFDAFADSEILVDDAQGEFVTLEEDQFNAELLVEEDTTPEFTGSGLTLNYNGGTYEGQSSYYYDEVPDYISIEPEKEGYTFIGWYEDAACTKLVSEYSIGSLPYELNLDTLYAGWTDKYCKVVVDFGEGRYRQDDPASNSFVMDKFPVGARFIWYAGSIDIGNYNSMNVANWMEFKKPIVDNGKYFKGWYVNDKKLATDGGDFDERLATKLITEDTVFTAKYVTADETWKVKVSANGGYFWWYDNSASEEKTSETLEIIVPKGEPLGDYDEYFVLENLRNDENVLLDGWSYDKAGTKPVDEKLIPDGIISFVPTSDCELYAQWIHYYDVTFDAGKGLVEGEDSLVFSDIEDGATLRTSGFYDEEDDKWYSYSVPTDVTAPAGKVFAGWSLTAAGDEILTVDEVYDYVITADTTFYAIYVDAITITFNANGGTFAPDNAKTKSITIPQKTLIGGNAPIVTAPEGKTFTGWYENASATGEAVDLYKTTAVMDKEYFAGYTDNGYYTITFKTGKDNATFKGETGTEVKVKVKKGQPMYYRAAGSNYGNVNTSPIIDYAAFSDKSVVPTSGWIGSDGNYYYFSSFYEVVRVNPGWHSMEGAENYMAEAFPSTGFVPTSDMTFTAEWADAIKVTFDANGAVFDNYLYDANGRRISISGNPFFELSSDKTKLVLTTFDGHNYNNVRSSLPTLTVKTQDGKTLRYYFGAFDKKGNNKVPLDYKLKNGDVIYAYPDETSSSTPKPTGEAFEVHLYANEGYFGIYNGSYARTFLINEAFEGTFYQVPSPMIDDDSLMFEGFYYDKELTQPVAFRESGTTRFYGFTKTKNVAYAKYTKAIAVTFDANGGYFDQGSSYNVAPSEDIRNTTKVTVKTSGANAISMTAQAMRLRRDDNKIFAGWFLDEACTNPVQTETIIGSDEVIYPEKAMTVYAKWISYTQKGDAELELSLDNAYLEVGDTANMTLNIPEELQDAKVNFKIFSYDYADDNTSYTFPVSIGSNGVVTAKGKGTVAFYATINGYKSNIVDVYVGMGEAPSWRDVLEEDRDKFDGIDSVATSGLVVSDVPSGTFSGDPITFDSEKIRVYYNGYRLEEGLDYTVSYKNNVNAFTLAEGETWAKLSAARAKVAPTATVTLTGSYEGQASVNFQIAQKPVAYATITSGTNLTALSTDKKFEPVLAVKAWTATGTPVTLTVGTDYTVFFNRITEDKVDYANELTEEDIKKDIAAGKFLDYVVNLKGKGNYFGNFERDPEIIGYVATPAPRLHIISAEEAKTEGILALDKAVVKLEAVQYHETAGTADVASEKIIADIASGKYPVKIGKETLKYVKDEEAAEKVTADGYYFTIEDPAAANKSMNRYPEWDNYIVLKATDLSATTYKNKLIGSLRVAITIKGTDIDVKNVTKSITFDGMPVLLDSSMDDENNTEILKRLGKGGKSASVVNKQTSAPLSGDAYEISAINNTVFPGTVTVVFTGNRFKGYTGEVKKDIRITPRKLTKSDLGKTVFVFFPEEIDPNNVPYRKTGATPEVIVGFGASVDEAMELVEGRDYKVSYSGNTKVNLNKKAGKVNLTFMGNLKGTIKAAAVFSVGKAEFVSADESETSTLYAEAADKAFKAKAAKGYFKSVPVIYDNGKKLGKGEYTISDAVYTYTDGQVIPEDTIVPAGTDITVIFTAKPTAKSSYTGNGTVFKATYKIGSKKLSDYKVTIPKQKLVSAGRPVIPEAKDITVKKGKDVLVYGKDYEIISITNNTKAGTATIVLKGKGVCYGTKKATFKIVK